jgi:PAS domain S-box-containing protein
MDYKQSFDGIREDVILSAIGEGSTDGITRVDRDGIIQSWTPGATRILGYEREEILGQHIDLCLPEEERERVRDEMLCQFQEKCGVIHEETVRISKSGHRIPVLLTRVPLKNEKGEVVALLAILKDISEEQKLRKKVEKLQRNTAMAKVAGKVAHEIRTPLGVLFLKSDLLVERLHSVFDDELDEQSKVGQSLTRHRKFIEKCITDIQKQVSRLEEIANNYLHLSRSRILDREEVSLKTFVRDVAIEVKEQYSNEPIQMDFEMEENLPTVLIDPQKFQRVVANLFRNSLEAIRSSHIENGWVKLRVYQENEQIIMEVSDNGPGMPEQIKERAFDPFTTTKSIGTGLGLYLVCEIVENHGGSITIDSAPNQGTKIRILLPLKEVKTSE